MAILSTAKVVGMLSSAKKTGRQILNAAGEYVSEVVEDFISGFTGQGWKIWEYLPGKWKLEIDSAVIRETLTVFELLIQKIRAVKGALCITQASGKIETAELKDGFWYITIEDEMSFVAGDFIRCQAWKGNGLKGYWVEIAEVKKIGEKDTILIAASEFTGGIIYDDQGMEAIDPALNEMTTPAIADEIVQFGNRTLKNRQSAIYLHADEGGQPAIDVLFGINKKSFSGCTKIRLGGDIPGSGGLKGFYCENGMIKGVDETGHTMYQIHPDGSAMFGDSSAEFKNDRSGYIAGGAISWRWDKTKGKFVTTMKDVILTWDNLSQEVRDNLKGEPGTPGEQGMQGEQGMPGEPGADGADAVIYKLRTSSSFIPIDTQGRAKVNYINVELYRTIGDGTPELCPDACAIYYTVYQGAATGSTTTLKNTAQIKTFMGEIDGENPIDKVLIGASVGTGNNQRTVDMLTLESVKDGFSSDWLRDWDNNQTLIDGKFVVSPKMFSGKRNANGTLTGVFSGRDCIRIDGVLHTGIFAVVNNKIIFSLDPEKGLYKFTGRIEADEGYFYGSISTPAKEITDANSSEYISEYLEGYQLKLSKEKGFNLRFSEGFTIMPLAVFLPLDYNLDGVELNLTHGFSVGFIVVMNVYDENMNKINCNVGPGCFARFKCIVLKSGNSSDSENVKQNNIKWIRLFGGSVSQV